MVKEPNVLILGVRDYLQKSQSRLVKNFHSIKRNLYHAFSPSENLTSGNHHNALKLKKMPKIKTSKHRPQTKNKNDFRDTSKKQIKQTKGKNYATKPSSIVSQFNECGIQAPLGSCRSVISSLEWLNNQSMDYIL